MFKRNGGDYLALQECLNSLHPGSPRNRDKMQTLGHFYYFICEPFKDEGVRDEWRIVGITSLIEAMMSEVEFKDVFQYFESSFKGENSISDFQKFKMDYLNEYGATKKVINFFRDYVSGEDVIKIKSCIRRWDVKCSKMVPLANVDEVPKFFYQMRSDFVHKAEMQNMCSEDSFASTGYVGDNFYDIRVGMKKILEIFEKSFVLFWKNKINL